MKNWTIEKDGRGKPIRLAYNARTPNDQVPGMPWCDELIVRTPNVTQHARIGHEGFDELVRLVELDGKRMDVLRLAVEHMELALEAEDVPLEQAARILGRVLLGVPVTERFIAEHGPEIRRLVGEAGRG